jgi:hypothetical protein
LNGAASAAGAATHRDLIEFKAFRTYSPIIAVRGTKAFNCLNSLVSQLDRPYYIVINTDEGEKKKGFAKTRKVFDGCVETPRLAKKMAAGEEVEVRPAEAQVILGNPKAGYTLMEMPSSGKNMVYGVQSMPGPSFTHGVGAVWGMEQNLALSKRRVPVSELYVFTRTGFGVGPKNWGGDSRGVPEVLDYMTMGLIESLPVTPMITGEGGILKRFYAHAFLVDVGVAGGMALYGVAPKVEEVKVGVVGFYFSPQVGLGVQLSPGALLRFNFGYRIGMAMALYQLPDMDKPGLISTAFDHGLAFGVAVHTNLRGKKRK